MAIPDDFSEECLYGPEAWCLHDVLEIDVEGQRVVGWLDTTRLELLVANQRAVPGHPKHLPGAVAIQMTGTLGQLHAVYVLGLRATEGWVGFGTHIEKAKFGSLGEIGPPVIATLQCTRRRQFRGTWFTNYHFVFTQEERLLYESNQTAAWFNPRL